MSKLFLVIAILLSINSKAQLRNLRFDKLAVENGLPEKFAACSLQDHLGYIWIGTQNGLVRYDGYEVKVYKLETDGNKERTLCIIESLFEDKNGNIWIGTYLHGLFRYNRLKDNFSVFSHGSSQSPAQSNDLVWQITEDKNGFIWTMSSTGFQERNHLDKVDPGTGTLISFDSTGKDSSNISKQTINALFSDTQGSIWLATNNGLFTYDEKTRKFRGHLAGKEIRYIYEAPSFPGILWLSVWNAGSANGLTRFNLKDKTSIAYNHSASHNNSLSNDSVFCVLEDHQKKIWVGTASGLSLLDPATQTFTSYLPSDINAEADANNCHDIKEDKNGALWIISGKGMLYLSPGKFTLQRFIADQFERDALPDNTLYNSLIDRNNRLWLGTYGNGILRLNEQKSSFEFIHYTGKEKSYPGGVATGFALLKDGTYLVSTTRGLFRCDSTFKNFSYIPLLQNIQSELPTGNITVDRDGIAWIGTAVNGLFSFNPVTNEIKHYVNNKRDSTSLSSNIISQVFEDRRRRLWIGTGGGGLCLLNKNSDKFLRLPFVFNAGDAAAHGALDDDQVSSLFEDEDGILWIGTNKGGLNRYNENENNFTSHYDPENGLASVTSIKEDHAGRLWIGTYLSGLFLFDRKKNTFKRFTEKDGLVFDNVESITEDRSGKLWIASGRGYSIIDPGTFQITKLTSADGLPDNKLTRSNLVLPNDTWIVGTAEGIIRFQPGTLTINPVPPIVHIQKITYAKHDNNKPIETSVLINDQLQLELAYNENRLTFQYVGIHFSNPALNQYSYQLVGYDKNWISAGTQRTITYTNLSPGTYTFQVKASNSDGVWSKDFAAFTIIIRPPWWQTYWAYALYLLALVLLIWAIVIYRSRALKRENKLLEEKVEDRTVQLKESFENLKATQSQLIQSEKMASLGELTAGVAHEIQNPLNFVNNFSEVNKELLKELNDEMDNGNIKDAKTLAMNVFENEEKINHHGRRADAIVKNMLQHSRAASGSKEPVDINALVDEYLRLAYHGFRARDKNFNASLNTSFDQSIGNINVVPQDIGRVLLNLFNNAFYAVAERKKTDPDFEPAVNLSTKKENDVVEISVKDNGTGIPQHVVNKIFQPFFTTKPTGQGTGLGLSLSYDIVKAHGGELKVETSEGNGSVFTIQLPIS